MNEAPLGKAGHDVDNPQFREQGAAAPSPAEPSRQPSQPNGVSHADFGTLIHPSPYGGAYRSTPGINVPAAAELWRLLHLDRARAVAQSDGRYKGQRVAFTPDDLERHLAGEITLAFTVLLGNRALFAVLDVDARFGVLLDVIRDAALAIGGEELLAAIFCTTGSDVGRGKIVVTFTQPAPALDVCKLIQRLCRAVRNSEPAQGIPRNKLSVYPQKGSGGVARILGRNVERGGPLEKPFSIAGELGLAHLRPLAPAKLTAMLADGGAGLATWARKRIETPWLRVEGTDKHYRWIVALAREAIRLYGLARGLLAYDGWLDRIKANSPELSLPSLKTKDERNILDHGRQRAWQYACKNPNSWAPLDLHIRKGAPRGVVRLYNALASFVREKGLRPASFGIDYERISLMIDSSKSTAHRWVRRAEEWGVIVIHDRGSKHAKGAPGQCTLLGLVCREQTPEQVKAAGGEIDPIRDRKADRPKGRASTE
jgi:hypothetical protein